MSALEQGIAAMNPDLPAGDVRNAHSQQLIADSLLGDEVQPEVEEQPEESGDDLTVEEWAANSLVDQPETEYVEEQEQPEQTEFEPQAEPVELTPQAVQEGIQKLDEAVSQLGLNDEVSAQRLALDLSAPFGGNPSEIDSKALGSTMSKAVLSAVQIYEATGGDPNQAGAIPHDSAVAFTSDFLRAWGIDPRISPVNPDQFAATMLGGTLNFIEAVNTHGLNATLDRLNSPEGAEMFADAIHRCFGINQPVTRERALAIADAGGRYILATLQKLASRQAQQPQQTRSRTRQSAPSRKSRFQTNQDIFDDEGEAIWNSRHGGL